VDLHKNANNLAKVILGQFDELKAKRWDKEFILALNSNLETWKSLKTKIEILVASEYGKKVINPESRDSLISLFNTIQQNAKLNGLG
jgi:hypothetical protein